MIATAGEIDALETLALLEEARGEKFKAAAYRRAMLGCEGGGRPLSQPGAEIRAKIAEFRRTGRIAALDKAMANPASSAALAFIKILGVGPALIADIISRKIYSIAALRAAVAMGKYKLPRIAEYGLKYYEDLQRPIPRATVAKIGEEIIGALGLRGAVIAGSFRRGLPFSGDVDILAFADDRAPKDLAEILRRSKGAIILSAGETKISALVRHEWVSSVDIFFARQEDFPAALLHFTGSRLFNIWLRELCAERGFSLSQYGLRESGRAVRKLKTENEIFDILGIPAIPPTDRNTPSSK